MRKLCSLFVALLASVSMLHASDISVNGIYYNFDNSTLTATVTFRGSYSDDYANEYSGSVTIPETVTYNGTTYSVTSIGERAFFKCSALTSITIPNSVTSIDRFAFYACSSLASITIGNSVKSIGYSAFFNCEGLTSITIGNSVTSIGESAFSSCFSLTSVTIPNSVTSIENCAFSHCRGLSSITIPNSVTSIGNRTFEDCSSLTSVIIGTNVTNIGSGAFSNCIGLSSITITAETIQDYCNSQVNSLLSLVGVFAPRKLIIADGEVTDLVIHNDIKNIRDCAFYNCTGLTNVTIGNSVTSIGEDAFCNCIGLTNVIIGNSVASIGSGAFYSCSSLASVTIGNSVTSIGQSAFSGCSSLTSVTIPNSVTSIGQSAFSSCSGLTDVVLGKYLTTLGDFSFYNCSNLTNIDIHESVTSIGESAFKGCISLASITIPNSAISIGTQAFYNCSSVTSITIPNSVTTIGAFAFSGCTALDSIVWNAKSCPNTGSLNSAPFYDICSQITSFTFGDSVRYIPNYLCNGMENITSITISKNVVSIENNVFTNCSSLKSIIWNANNCTDFYAAENAPFYDIRSQITSFNFGEDVEHIPAYLCYGMKNIPSLELPSNIKKIGTSAFEDSNYPIKSLIIPNTVTNIGKNAFRNCSSIESVIIGKSVASIGENAFANCNSINSVTWDAKHCSGFGMCYIGYIEGELYQFIDSSPFTTNVSTFTFGNEVEHIPSCLCLGMKNLKSLTIPNSVTSIGSGAFYGCTALTSVNIPQKVNSIDMMAFAGCPSRTSISVANENSTYDSRNNCNAIIEKTTNTLIAGCKNTTIPNDVLHIGDYAFYGGGSSFTSMTIPASVETIGEFAFGECPRLYDIYCYAAVPPIAKQSSFSNYNAFVHVPCESQRYYVSDGIWSKFKNYECITSDNVTTDGVYTTPSTNDVTIIWPIETGADSYVIVIMKETEVVCTLTFNADGQLLNIAFAPSRDGSRPAQHTQYAEQTTDGYRFTVTGLEAATHYTYDITVKDIANNTIKTHSGEFTTQSNAPTPVDNIPSSTINCQKIFRDGQLLILRDGKTYNMKGQEL